MTRQTVTHLDVQQLVRHPSNVREDLGDLTELAASIREHGILQPLTVTEHPTGSYLLIAGHRRLGAARMAGLSRVPVVIRHQVDDEAEQIVLMLVENVQRRDLSPVEKAEAYGALRHRGLTVSEISRRTGVHVSTISTLLTLLELDDDSLEDVREGHLNAGDAIAAVREARQAQRQRGGRPSRGRPVIVDPPHFTPAHPLAPEVARICGHTTRPKVGQTQCCGECWEAVIRADARGEEMPEAAYDEAVVQRILDGSNVHASPPDRVEVVRRWRAAGKPLAELERRLGWKPQRYYLPARRQREGAA